MRAIVSTELPNYRDALRQFALNVGLDCAAEDCVGLEDAVARMMQVPADVVLVMLGADPTVALNVIQKLSHQVAVLAVGPGQDPALILKTLRSGAREFLDQKKLREELVAALERLQQSGGLKIQRGKTIAVTSPNPGSGVTTVASGLAFSFAQKHKNQVVLAELGIDVPELAIDLDFHPRISIDQMFLDWERMDQAMIKQALTEHPAGVHLLAHHPETLQVDPVRPEAIRHTLRLLRTMYDFSVLDLGFSCHSAALEAMKIADSIVVVVRLDVPSLRLNRQYLKQLADAGIPVEKMKTVINRYGQSRQITWRKVEEALGLPPTVWIPEDQGTLNYAINQGQPLIQVARRARITKRMDELAYQLNGAAAAKK